MAKMRWKSENKWPEACVQSMKTWQTHIHLNILSSCWRQVYSHHTINLLQYDLLHSFLIRFLCLLLLPLLLIDCFQTFDNSLSFLYITKIRRLEPIAMHETWPTAKGAVDRVVGWRNVLLRFTGFIGIICHHCEGMTWVTERYVATCAYLNRSALKIFVASQKLRVHFNVCDARDGPAYKNFYKQVYFGFFLCRLNDVWRHHNRSHFFAYTSKPLWIHTLPWLPLLDFVPSTVLYMATVMSSRSWCPSTMTSRIWRCSFSKY